MRYGVTQPLNGCHSHGTHYPVTHNVSRRRKLDTGWGEAISQRRESLGLTQEQVAQRMGPGMATQSSVQRWENGSFPGMDRIPALASALEWTIEDLVKATRLTSGVPVPDQSRQEARAQGLWKRSRREDAEQPPKRKRGRG